jgi:hypothetical protein
MLMRLRKKQLLSAHKFAPVLKIDVYTSAAGMVSAQPIAIVRQGKCLY